MTHPRDTNVSLRFLGFTLTTCEFHDRATARKLAMKNSEAAVEAFNRFPRVSTTNGRQHKILRLQQAVRNYENRRLEDKSQFLAESTTLSTRG